MGYCVWETQIANKQRRWRESLPAELHGLLLIKLLASEALEHFVFEDLLMHCPGLEDKLAKSSEEEVELIADLVLFSHVQLIAWT